MHSTTLNCVWEYEEYLFVCLQFICVGRAKYLSWIITFLYVNNYFHVFH